MMSVSFKSLLLFLSLLFVCVTLSCETQTAEITPAHLQHAEKHLEENMNGFIWKASGSYIDTSNISFTSVQIINSYQNVILVTLNYKNGKVLSFKYNYTVLPYKDAEYVELSLMPLSDYPTNYVINSFSIKLKDYKKGNISIKINNSSLMSFHKENDKDTSDNNNGGEAIPPIIDDNTNINPDNKPNDDSLSNNGDSDNNTNSKPNENNNEENIPSDGTPSYPSINTDSKVIEFQNSLFSYDYGLNDFYKQTYRYEYYPLSNTGSKYFVYEYKTEDKYYDPVTNEELLYPRILLYFSDSYSLNNSGHTVMKGSLVSAFLRSGEKEKGYSYYNLNNTQSLIQRIEIEILYNSPSSYHVIVSDDKNKTKKREDWVKLGKRR